MSLNRGRSTAPPILLLSILMLAACGGGQGVPDDGEDPIPDAGEVPSDSDAGDEDPTDPDEEEPGDEDEDEEDTQQVTVGREAKQVTLSDGSSFSIPQNALAEPVEITISRVTSSEPAVGAAALGIAAEGEGRTVSYLIEPFGIEFLLPVTLSLPLPEGAESSEGWIVESAPDFDTDPMSLGRHPNTDAVVAEITSTGIVSVQEDTGTRTVLGTAKRTHILPDGSITTTNANVGLLKVVFQDSEGERQEKSTELSADGTFRFDDVPSGVYQLHYHWMSGGQSVRMDVLETDDSVIDLGSTSLVRPDAVPASPGTAVDLQLDSPEVPFPADRFYVGAPSADRFDVLYGWNPEEEPGPVFPLTRLTGGNLLNAEAGDVLTVSRLRQRQSSNDHSYHAAFDRAQDNTITQVDGEEVVTVLSLEPYPQSREVEFTVQAPEFFAEVGLAGDSSCYPSISVDVEAYREHDALTPTTELAGPYVPLLMYELPGTDMEFSTGKMTYGSDSSEPGSEVVYVAGMSFGIDELLLPGTTIGPSRVCAFSSRNGIPVSEATSKPLSPALSPPPSLSVNGLPASAPIDGVPAAALELEWEAPSRGTADLYGVMLYRLEVSGTRTYIAGANLLWTRDTQIAVPAELILPGGSYFIRLNAYSRPAGALRGHLRYPAGLSQAFADSRIIQIAN